MSIRSNRKTKNAQLELAAWKIIVEALTPLKQEAREKILGSVQAWFESMLVEAEDATVEVVS